MSQLPFTSLAPRRVEILKQGYLNKQGGARGGRKNWKKRWFVLKEDCLYYYSSPEVSSLLGVMPLNGSSLLDLEAEVRVTAPPARAEQRVCHECKKAFSLTVRRHHCRHCGNTYCGECTSKSIIIPKFGFHIKVRVCDPCYVIVEQELESSTIAQRIIDLPINLNPKKVNTNNLNAHPNNQYININSNNVNQNNKSVSSINAHNANDGVKFTLPTQQKPHLFALKNSERELWLHADSLQDRLEWVDCIKSVQRRHYDRSKSSSKLNQSQNNNAVNTNNKENNWEIDFPLVTLLNKLGDGAFGEVFRARLWGTEIAVKTLKTEQFQSPELVLAELTKEVSILSKLRHPNVVLYIGACTTPPNVCIMTEWCGKGSLHDVLHDDSVHLDAKQLLDIAMGVAQGMNYLHSLEKKIIHRDLKSHNILVTKNWQVKVADFGLSHVREQRANGSISAGSNNSGNPKHYGIFGTPEWMAPEVMEGQQYTEKIDVYSYGILLSECVTRSTPFHDQYHISNYLDVVDAVLDNGAIPTIPRWCENFLKPIIIECLNRNPSERPSFTDIILKLRSLMELDDSVFFYQFDIPRIRELLQCSSPHIQSLAASEIAMMVANRKLIRKSTKRPLRSNPNVHSRNPGNIANNGAVIPESDVEFDGPSSFAFSPHSSPNLLTSSPFPNVNHENQLGDPNKSPLSPVFSAIDGMPAPLLLEPPAPVPVPGPAPAVSNNNMNNNNTNTNHNASVASSRASPITATSLPSSRLPKPIETFNLDDDDAVAIEERLTDLLSSSSEDVQLNSCCALSSLLRSCDNVKLASDRITIIGEGGIRPLMNLIMSKNKDIAREAGELLLLLSSGNVEEHMYSGMDLNGLSEFEGVVEKDIERTCEMLNDLEILVSSKRRLLQIVAAVKQKENNNREQVHDNESITPKRTVRPNRIGARKGRGGLRSFKFGPSQPLALKDSNKNGTEVNADGAQGDSDDDGQNWTIQEERLEDIKKETHNQSLRLDNSANKNNISKSKNSSSEDEAEKKNKSSLTSSTGLPSNQVTPLPSMLQSSHKHNPRKQFPPFSESSSGTTKPTINSTPNDPLISSTNPSSNKSLLFESVKSASIKSVTPTVPVESSFQTQSPPSPRSPLANVSKINNQVNDLGFVKNNLAYYQSPVIPDNDDVINRNLVDSVSASSSPGYGSLVSSYTADEWASLPQRIDYTNRSSVTQFQVHVTRSPSQSISQLAAPLNMVTGVLVPKYTQNLDQNDQIPPPPPLNDFNDDQVPPPPTLPPDTDEPLSAPQSTKSSITVKSSNYNSTANLPKNVNSNGNISLNKSVHAQLIPNSQLRGSASSGMKQIPGLQGLASNLLSDQEGSNDDSDNDDDEDDDRYYRDRIYRKGLIKSQDEEEADEDSNLKDENSGRSTPPRLLYIDSDGKSALMARGKFDNSNNSPTKHTDEDSDNKTQKGPIVKQLVQSLEKRIDKDYKLTANEKDRIMLHDKLLDLLLKNAPMPIPFQDRHPYFIQHGYALRYEVKSDCWNLCYLVLTEHHLRVFQSNQHDPSQPSLTIRTKTTNGEPTKVKVGTRYGMPNCFVVEDCGYAHVFCAGNPDYQIEWRSAIARGKPSDSTEPETRDKLRAKLPILDSPPHSFLEIYPNLECQGYLLCLNSETMEWEQRYLVYVDHSLKFFLSHKSNPEEPIVSYNINIKDLDPSLGPYKGPGPSIVNPENEHHGEHATNAIVFSLRLDRNLLLPLPLFIHFLQSSSFSTSSLGFLAFVCD